MKFSYKNKFERGEYSEWKINVKRGVKAAVERRNKNLSFTATNLS